MADTAVRPTVMLCGLKSAQPVDYYTWLDPAQQYVQQALQAVRAVVGDGDRAPAGLPALQLARLRFSCAKAWTAARPIWRGIAACCLPVTLGTRVVRLPWV
jgi:hypothetical protein